MDDVFDLGPLPLFEGSAAERVEFASVGWGDRGASRPVHIGDINSIQKPRLDTSKTKSQILPRSEQAPVRDRQGPGPCTLPIRHSMKRMCPHRRAHESEHRFSRPDSLPLAAGTEAPTAPLTERGAASTSAGAATVVRGSTEEPISGLMFSCDGEPIAIEGTITFRWHNTRLPSGHWQLSQHTRFQSRGVGVNSGRTYIHRAVFTRRRFFAVPMAAALPRTFGDAHGIVQGSGDTDFSDSRELDDHAGGVVAVCNYPRDRIRLPDVRGTTKEQAMNPCLESRRPLGATAQSDPSS